MSDEMNADLLALTAEIVSSHVANNSVHAANLPKMISSIHAALASLGAANKLIAEEPEHKPAVSVRKSLASPDHIISMIDGKPYRALRRHIAKHGMTDKEYRARYNLPDDYPMVAKTYSAARSALAAAIGLGRKAGTKVKAAAETASAAAEEVAAPAAEKIKRATKKASENVAEPAALAKRRIRRTPA